MEWQTFVDKFICFCMGIVILDGNVQLPHPFFRTKRTQVGAWSMCVSLLGFNPQWHLLYVYLVSYKVCK